MNAGRVIVSFAMIVVLGIAGTSDAQKSKSRKSNKNVQIVEIPKADYKLEMPVYVKIFSTQNTVVKGDNSKKAAKVAAKKQRVPAHLASVIVKRLNAVGHKAILFDGAVDTTGGLILEGDIALIHNGSGSTRFWVGYGSGKARLWADVKMYFADESSHALIHERVISRTSGGLTGSGGVLAGGNIEKDVNQKFARNMTSRINDISAAIAHGNTPHVTEMAPITTPPLDGSDNAVVDSQRPTSNRPKNNFARNAKPIEEPMPIPAPSKPAAISTADALTVESGNDDLLEQVATPVSRSDDLIISEDSDSGVSIVDSTAEIKKTREVAEPKGNGSDDLIISSSNPVREVADTRVNNFAKANTSAEKQLIVEENEVPSTKKKEEKVEQKQKKQEAKKMKAAAKKKKESERKQLAETKAAEKEAEAERVEIAPKVDDDSLTIEDSDSLVVESSIESSNSEPAANKNNFAKNTKPELVVEADTIAEEATPEPVVEANSRPTIQKQKKNKKQKTANKQNTPNRPRANEKFAETASSNFVVEYSVHSKTSPPIGLRVGESKFMPLQIGEKRYASIAPGTISVVFRDPKPKKAQKPNWKNYSLQVNTRGVSQTKVTVMTEPVESEIALKIFLIQDGKITKEVDLRAF